MLGRPRSELEWVREKQLVKQQARPVLNWPWYDIAHPGCHLQGQATEVGEGPPCGWPKGALKKTMGVGKTWLPWLCFQAAAGLAV